MKNIFTVFLFFVFVLNPVFSQNKEAKKSAKKLAAQNEYEAMKTLINSETFEFVGTWASTISGRQINLNSNPTFIKMDAKKANGFLPFFGTSHAPSFGPGSGIEFEGEVEDYEVTTNDKKQQAIINFTTNGKSSETLDVTITVFGSLNASVTIHSSTRSTMRYSGKIIELKKQEN
jgi:hypothetical protein